jgi:AAA domain, putative AbiEii toxin, Type IV TA system
MTDSEINKLHNIFIKLKNNGKNLEEIKNQLRLDEALVDSWNTSFETTKNQIKSNPKGISISISGINDVGNYTYSNSISIQMSSLQRAIFDLKRILMNEDIGGEWVDKAKKYLPIFQKYFIDIELEMRDTIFGSVKFTLNTPDLEITKLAREAAEFYGNVYKTIIDIEKENLIIEESEDKFRNSADILDYSLKRLEVEKYEGIERLSIIELPIDTKWIFFIGENSYGKTTILKSIAIGLFGRKDEDIQFLDDNLIEKISIEYNSLGMNRVNNVSTNNQTKLEYFACYGASRLEIQSNQTQNDISKKSTTTYSLFNSDGILLNIEYSLVIWSLKESTKFKAVKEVFKKLIPYLEDIQITNEESVLYIEKEPTEDGEVYNPVSFNQLASGFRSLIAMVGDMMIRLYKSQPGIVNPSDLAGIVIIDELDLHWHPKMQREMPKLLSDIFPKVQFIASTHSLVPLLGAPENSVLLKVNRTKKEGITVDKIEIDFQALSTDSMLQIIFDLEKYMSDAKIKAWERFKKLTRLIKAEQSLDAKETLMDERRDIGNKYSFPV